MNEELEKEINETIGAASMCWSETPKGIFDSEKATILAKNLQNAIFYELQETIRDTMVQLKKDIGLMKPSTQNMTHDLKGQCDFERINTLNDVLRLIGNPELSSPFTSDET